MPTIFPTENAGRVVMVEGGHAGAVSGRSIVRTDPAIDWATHRVLITGFGYTPKCGMQVSHSFGNDAFLKSFGHRASPMIISGLAPHQACNDSNDIGLERMIKFHEENCVAGRSDPIRITLGRSMAKEIYLFESDFSVRDPAMPLTQFTFNTLAR